MSEFEDFLDNEIKFTDSKRDCVLKTWDYKQAEIDELRKRIDEALRFYNDAKSPHNIGMIQMAIYLKGTTNEQ